MIIADRIFKAQADLRQAEELLYEKLREILGEVDWVRVELDPSDLSFEAYEFTPYDIQPSKDQLGQIGDLGFVQFWIHSIDRRLTDRSTERHFMASRGRA